MAEYRYMTVNLLTRRVVEDLPLYGVNITRRISAAGSITGTFKLGTGLFSDEDLLNASEPGWVALIVLRDEAVIWGGPVWSRTYQSQSNSVQLTGQSYESVFSSVRVLNKFDRDDVDQLTIFKDMITTMQAQEGNNFGFSTSQIGTSGVTRDITIQSYEDRMWADGIDELLKQENSFDYTIEPYMDANGDLQITVRTGYPYLGYNAEPIAFDYPGQITNYWWPESAARGASRLSYTGRGEGKAMKRATVTDSTRIALGMPAWDMTLSDKSIRDQNKLNRIAASAALQYRIPVSTPTFEIKLTEDIEFAEWANLGVPVQAHIEDARFPQGAEITRRMLGWDLSPSSSENIDELKLVVEGDEDA